MEASVAEYCRAPLHYASNADVAGTVAVEVSIRDGRQGAPAYADGGFELLTHASAVRDWRDAEEVARVHRREIERLALDFLNCDRALVYAPLVRSPVAASATPDYAPIFYVHSDYTDDYRSMICGPDRAYRSFLQPVLDEADLDQQALARASRIVMLQFWRNTGAQRPDHPLALCDARTVAANELHAFLVPEYGGERIEFQTYAVEAPATPTQHEWYTYPALHRDEVLAFRTYDSLLADAGGHFWTPHTAFADPLAGPDAPRRESVEMRVLCLWDV